MFLGSVAERWAYENVEAFDELTGQFVPLDMLVRVSLVDRFLSNFNRPLRRRMIHFKMDDQLPESHTLKVVTTGDVYIVGQERADSNETEAYHKMSLAHLVTYEGPNGSAGLAEVYRWSPDGPQEDPGWLTKKRIGQHYCDSEFRTSLNEGDLVDERIETFVFFMQKDADVDVHDQVLLNQREYRVTDTFPDSGLLQMRADREANYFVDFVIMVKNGTRYDQEAMKYVAEEKSYNVTGLMASENDYTTWSSDSDDVVMLSVNESHIGFKPEAGMEVQWEGRKRTIRHVAHYRGERQYKLRCR